MVRTAEPGAVPRPSRLRTGRVVAVAGLAVVAYCLVWLPLFSDQAVMALIGRDIVAGRHLYTEILDAKQPGMHLWYGAIGFLFGPHQPVYQLFSVLAALGAAALLTWLLVDRLGPGWVRSWAPVLVAGGLLLTLDEFHLGQAELVVLVPGVAALALVAGRTGAGRPTAARAVLAGGCLGVVLVVKALLVAVPGAAVLAFVLLAARPGRGRTLVALVVGGLLAPAATVLWLAAAGDLPAALHAWFTYPSQVLALADVRSPEELVGAGRRFLLLFAGVGVLALWRLRTVLRGRDPLDVAFVAWCLAGVAVYAVQVWWHYYLLVLVPGLVGLAVRQLDDLSRRTGRARRAGLPAVALLTVPMIVYGLLGAALVLRDGAGLTAASRDAVAARVADYDDVRAELAAAGLRPGDALQVFGDSRYQLLADRPYALSTNGWSAEFIPPQRWELIATELAQRRPDLVMVSELAAEAMRERAPAARAVLERDYTVVRTSPAGTWYRAT